MNISSILFCNEQGEKHSHDSHSNRDIQLVSPLQTQPKQKQSWSLKYQTKNKTLQSVQNFAQSEIQKQILTPKTYFMK